MYRPIKGSRFLTRALNLNKPTRRLSISKATHSGNAHTTDGENSRKPLFNKILIANRGEIACRVMRTAKALGIQTVAVYSEADAESQHVKMADEAYCIGPAASSESYLMMDRILEVARSSGAQAIHPGYGFLSENAGFAKTIQESGGIEFVGPPPQAMISMGSKSESKHIMEAAGVPVVPGYHGDNQDPGFLQGEADSMGYPVLIKAIKGGGGKGMRIVNEASEFLEMLESSKREARKSFGDDKVLVEKYLAKPRHVEVQVFADKHGNVVHLFERDCSVQRRHQKIIEEAPAPGLPIELQQDLGNKAVAAARAVGYVGAGTVEFILDTLTDKFYFMEMNTRLQVEHPVTEMVTNVDLVQWQLEVAAGNPLPLSQEEICLSGHAFEARIYAENPRKGFLPDVGPLLFLTPPDISSNVRVETGVVQGDEVSVHYDPMIAKLVCWGRDRDEALRTLRVCLKNYQIAGLSTNIDFLRSLAAHPAFVSAELDTGFIPKHFDTLFPPIQIHSTHLARAALRLLLSSSRSGSPWDITDVFRVNLPRSQRLSFIDPTKEDSQVINVDVTLSRNVYDIQIFYPDGSDESLSGVRLLESESSNLTHQLVTEINGSRQAGPVVLLPPNARTPGQLQLQLFNPEGQPILVTPPPAHLSSSSNSAASGSVRAPMPCKIIQFMTKVGDKVEAGQPLVVLEAMKMEHVIKAPADGVIARIPFSQVGQLVPDNAELIIFE
ncbi:hypothetical protein DSO57_1006200 [Entomophthora muscae]|uniref:Uncharacterized protein n=1 Tax=Entomophthora muscae TaxID=34485 RepID=A0ACC2S9V7_9FUNG|nr:hypothetical protein DSO57_1006200 [Entomophthora muscae]